MACSLRNHPAFRGETAWYKAITPQFWFRRRSRKRQELEAARAAELRRRLEDENLFVQHWSLGYMALRLREMSSVARDVVAKEKGMWKMGPPFSAEDK
jgi:hypothetical protein